MLALNSAQTLADMISASACLAGLDEALSVAANQMDFQFYALARHPRRHRRDGAVLRIHNYPREWEESYDRRRLGICDPVHRASHRVTHGFRWQEARNYVPMGERDEEMLDEARRHGIADGYTVPANIPGEAAGSVTFATSMGRPFPMPMLLYAQALGGMAYHQARVIAGAIIMPDKREITDRQVEVIKWVGRDKTDGEIAQILDVSRSTVTKHIRDSCARFNTYKRTSLALRAIWSGYLCFTDIFE
jgi:LuxR family quorum-sensing system transcriptional regulator CciR